VGKSAKFGILNEAAREGKLETRELFWSFGKTEIAVFYGVGMLAVAAFLFGLWKHFEKYRNARSGTREYDWRKAFKRLITDLATHRKIGRRDRTAGWAHGAIFAGFLIAFVGTATITLDYDIVQPILGLSFWKGNFYLVFSLVLDLGGLALLIGLILMAWRRWVTKPSKLSYLREYKGESEVSPQAQKWIREDVIFLVALIVITVTGFLLEGLRLYMDKPAWAHWSPVGQSVALGYGALGLDLETAGIVRGMNWWFHGLLSLAFIAAVPWYKAKHIVSVLGSLALREERPLSKLPSEQESEEISGISKLSDFTVKDMFDFDACTKCGRCQDVCPATATGYPLSPRDLILDLRTANASAAAGSTPVDQIIADETLWSCRTCGACQEICPVGVEHPSKIVRMRRALVDQGRIDPMLQTAFAALGNVGNSFGESARKRSAWTEELDFPVKDIRIEPAQYLWFVGDYASFDPRNQRVSRTVARLLRAAKVDFALLHEGEHSAGNDVRRAGEEGLFSQLSEHNLAQMDAAQPFKRIITTDPHSYNTIRNEYPEYQDVAEIDHYSTVLADLLRDGTLKVTKPLNRRVTFHDPCHLGRLNQGYDAPREVLELIGCELVEMPRNRDNSFCCGAGGGRIWMPDQPGEKPSENRMREAAGLEGVDAFITACPKDLTMFEDANKTADHAGSFTIDDLAELVAEAVELEKIEARDLPDVIGKIIERSSELIADRVLGELRKSSAQLRIESDRSEEAAQFSTAGQAASLSPPASKPDLAPADTADADGDISEQIASPAQDTSVDVPKNLRPMSWKQKSPAAAMEFPPYEIPERVNGRILVIVRHVGVLNEGFEIAGSRIPAKFLDYRINEWDEAAMEQALLIAEKIEGCEVVAVTIGNEDAEISLRKAMAMGADRGVRISVENLDDCDPIAIACRLAGVAKLEGPDLLLCGVQSADFGHGSTGTAVAGILGLPHSSAVVECTWDGAGQMALTRELEGGILQKLNLAAPALLTIQTGANQPRYATMRMIKQAKKKPLEVVDGHARDDETGGYVLQEVYEPAREQAAMLDLGIEDLADFIIQKVQETRGA